MHLTDGAVWVEWHHEAGLVRIRVINDFLGEFTSMYRFADGKVMDLRCDRRHPIIFFAGAGAVVLFIVATVLTVMARGAWRLRGS